MKKRSAALVLGLLLLLLIVLGGEPHEGEEHQEHQQQAVEGVFIHIGGLFGSLFVGIIDGGLDK